MKTQKINDFRPEALLRNQKQSVRCPPPPSARSLEGWEPCPGQNWAENPKLQALLKALESVAGGPGGEVHGVCTDFLESIKPAPAADPEQADGYNDMDGRARQPRRRLVEQEAAGGPLGAMAPPQAEQTPLRLPAAGPTIACRSGVPDTRLSSA